MISRSSATAPDIYRDCAILDSHLKSLASTGVGSRTQNSQVSIYRDFD